MQLCLRLSRLCRHGSSRSTESRCEWIREDWTTGATGSSGDWNYPDSLCQRPLPGPGVHGVSYKVRSHWSIAVCVCAALEVSSGIVLYILW